MYRGSHWISGERVPETGCSRRGELRKVLETVLLKGRASLDASLTREKEHGVCQVGADSDHIVPAPASSMSTTHAHGLLWAVGTAVPAPQAHAEADHLGGSQFTAQRGQGC